MRILRRHAVSKNNLSSYFPIEWMIKQNHIHPRLSAPVYHSVCLACLSVSQSPCLPVHLTLRLVAGAHRLLRVTSPPSHHTAL